MSFLFLVLITKMNLHVKKNICNHGKCDWVKEAMVGEKPTTLMCTVLPINHTNLCYKACSVFGEGFDLTSDFRLKFAKGTQRLVVGDEFNNRDILIPVGPTVPTFLSIFVVIKGIDFASSPMFLNSTRFPFFPFFFS